MPWGAALLPLYVVDVKIISLCFSAGFLDKIDKPGGNQLGSIMWLTVISFRYRVVNALEVW